MTRSIRHLKDEQSRDFVTSRSFSDILPDQATGSTKDGPENAMMRMGDRGHFPDPGRRSPGNDSPAAGDRQRS
jgi:hypothetical protein